ncbi:MAG: efflux RND transporter periplasmic adaptor subunit [Porticoccaceae bacterium]
MPTTSRPARVAASLLLFVCAILLSVPRARAENIARVEVAPAARQALINEIPLSGNVVTTQIATLSTEVAGLVSRVHVDAGDAVAAGDTVLELDPELSEIALAQARANALQAREALADSQRRLDEAQTLVERMSISASEVRSLAARVRIDSAALEAAQAQVRQHQAQLRRHGIAAPFDGTVSRKLVEEGEWVVPGSGVLELVSVAQLYIDFQVPQRFYALVNDEARIDIRFDAHPGKSFAGRMHRKVPLANDSARTFLLRASLAEKDDAQLIPGMSANATLHLGTGLDGIAVSRDALRRYSDGRVSVWVIDGDPAQDGSASVREQLVDTGLAFTGMIEIRSGLAAGQLVVTRGNESLREGQTVRILNGP